MKKVAITGFVFLLMSILAGCFSTESNAHRAASPKMNVQSSTQNTGELNRTSPSASTAVPVDGKFSDLMEVPHNESGIATYHDFNYHDTNRNYMLYIPQNTRKNAPLVFVLHGYMDFAASFMNATGMNAIADREGFGVVYPQGLSSRSTEFPGTHWNADFTYTDINDTGYIAALAEYLQENYGFSKDEIFACGLSNGGFMCYTLAEKSPGTFRAIASVAGTMSLQTWEDRDESTALPLLQIHGTADTTVPIDGTMIPDGGWGGAPSMETIIQYWAKKDGANSVREETHDNITIQKYENDGDACVWYCLIDGFGHGWPTKQNSGLDAGELIWQFFRIFLNEK